MTTHQYLVRSPTTFALYGASRTGNRGLRKISNIFRNFSKTLLEISGHPSIFAGGPSMFDGGQPIFS